MDQENVEFLTKNVKYLGFEEKVSEAMGEQIKQGNPEFNIAAKHSHFDNSIDYTLHFRQSENSGRYFLNKYDATLTNGVPGEDKKQTFYIKNGKGVTAKEAYNLLEGRYVYKELLNKEQEKYNSRMKLDFNNQDDKGNYKYIRYSDAYGYKLEDTLAKIPIREMQESQQAEMLVKSLNRGNLQQVQIDSEQNPGKYYITPDPVKGLHIYNERMQPVEQKSLGIDLRFKRQQSEKQGVAEKPRESEGKGQKKSQKTTTGRTTKKQSKGPKMKAA